MERPDLNRHKAIREFCFDCMGYQRRKINRCHIQDCPLWEFRRGPGRKERTEEPFRAQKEGWS